MCEGRDSGVAGCMCEEGGGGCVGRGSARAPGARLCARTRRLAACAPSSSCIIVHHRVAGARPIAVSGASVHVARRLTLVRPIAALLERVQRLCGACVCVRPITALTPAPPFDPPRDQTEGGCPPPACPGPARCLPEAAPHCAYVPPRSTPRPHLLSQNALSRSKTRPTPRQPS